MENDSKYIDYLLSKLWIIEEENILKKIDQLEWEKGIELSKFAKEDYLKFQNH